MRDWFSSLPYGWPQLFQSRGTKFASRSKKTTKSRFKSIGVFEQCCMTSIEDFEGSPSKQRDPGSEIAEPGITPAHLRIEGDNQ